MKAFISHSGNDADWAKKVKRLLSQHGVDSFLSSHGDIQGGDDFVGRVKSALDEATHFILLHSRASAESNWVEHELHCAIAARNNGTASRDPRARRTKRLSIIPLCLDETPLHLIATPFQAIHVDKKGLWRNGLLRALGSDAGTAAGSRRDAANFVREETFRSFLHSLLEGLLSITVGLHVTIVAAFGADASWYSEYQPAWLLGAILVIVGTLVTVWWWRRQLQQRLRPSMEGIRLLTEYRGERRAIVQLSQRLRDDWRVALVSSFNRSHFVAVGWYCIAGLAAGIWVAARSRTDSDEWDSLMPVLTGVGLGILWNWGARLRIGSYNWDGFVQGAFVPRRSTASERFGERVCWLAMVVILVLAYLAWGSSTLNPLKQGAVPLLVAVALTIAISLLHYGSLRAVDGSEESESRTARPTLGAELVGYVNELELTLGATVCCKGEARRAAERVLDDDAEVGPREIDAVLCVARDWGVRAARKLASELGCRRAVCASAGDWDLGWLRAFEVLDFYFRAYPSLEVALLVVQEPGEEAQYSAGIARRGRVPHGHRVRRLAVYERTSVQDNEAIPKGDENIALSLLANAVVVRASGKHLVIVAQDRLADRVQGVQRLRGARQRTLDALPATAARIAYLVCGGEGRWGGASFEYLDTT